MGNWGQHQFFKVPCNFYIGVHDKNLQHMMVAVVGACLGLILSGGVRPGVVWAL